MAVLEIEILAAPQIGPLPSRDDSAWRREYRAFLRLLPNLIPQYRGQYVAVYNEQVIDHDPSDIALVQRVIGKIGYVPLHVGLVTDELRPPARVPSARVPRDPR